MYTIVTANQEQYLDQIRDLVLEYLSWQNLKLIEHYGTGIDDVQGYVTEDMKHIDRFMPPLGCFLLSYVDEHLAGMAALKTLGPGMGEIKRMYVRPAYRRQGLGRALLNQLLEESYRKNYHCLRLDSGPYLFESHQLYRSAGFQEIEPYEETEVPKQFHKNWIFMEKQL